MQEMPRQIEEDKGDEIGEILRVLRLCHPDFETSLALTFLAGRKDPVADWNQWCERLFLEGIAPTLVNTMELAARGHSRDVRELDQEQDRWLPESERARSRDAGRSLLTSFHAPAGARVLEKMRACLDADETPGHFAVVYGVRCALFNIPRRLAILGYLYAEWQIGTRWMISARHMPDFSLLFEDIHAPASSDPEPLLFVQTNGRK